MGRVWRGSAALVSFMLMQGPSTPLDAKESIRRVPATVCASAYTLDVASSAGHRSWGDSRPPTATPVRTQAESPTAPEHMSDLRQPTFTRCAELLPIGAR
jgi:hypothetical protein